MVLIDSEADKRNAHVLQRVPQLESDLADARAQLSTTQRTCTELQSARSDDARHLKALTEQLKQAEERARASEKDAAAAQKRVEKLTAKDEQWKAHSASF